ncbi:MAG: hypothetical protein H6765_10070 [Candidatus Peribacteria bacterium]|nr:MAG: hypothetical protein H6765_10070 [Candidatus Peribacteria bacterium]
MIKSILVKYLLLILIFIGMNPQWGLVSDVDNACLDEVAFENCMNQHEAQQDTCYIQALLPDCDPADLEVAKAEKEKKEKKDKERKEKKDKEKNIGDELSEHSSADT